VGKIQIIMPNLNYGQFIGPAIESVINQTYKDWELFICDGGSTDNSLEVIKSFNDSRIKLIENKIRPSERMNQTAKLSDSEWITILASDDKWFPEYLQKNIDCAEADENVDFIYNSYWDGVMNKDYYHPHWVYRKDLLMEAFYMGVFWFVKRELWNAVGGMVNDVGMDTENPIPFDYDFCLRCEEAGGVFKYLDSRAGWYRQWEGSDTGKHSPQWLANVGENARKEARKRRAI
jgi:glycosyltransferase involved in cell wall biosynthesis